MSQPKSTFRIDVHQHPFPNVFKSLLESIGILGGGGVEFPLWDEETTLEVMDKYDIHTSMLSYTLAAIEISDLAFYRRLARESNEYLAELINKYPGRFGGLALLPLPDVDGALKEIEYALDVLKLDGVGMHSNMGGIYPGDQEFAPVFNELNRRKAVIYLHPTDTPGNHSLRPQWPPYIVEFIFDTTRAVSNLIYSGTMEEYPDVSIILAHAGGAIPYIAWRLWTGEFSVPNFNKVAPAGVYEYLKRFYYDTGMASNSATFGALTELVEPSQIVFGTDYPYMPDMLIEKYLSEIDNYPRFDLKSKSAIVSGNALGLFPRINGKPEG